jgi:RNA polymerase sigma-70 factor, ECF subfamily
MRNATAPANPGVPFFRSAAIRRRGPSVWSRGDLQMYAAAESVSGRTGPRMLMHTMVGRGEQERSEDQAEDDTVLMAAIVRGEREALGRLYDRHAGVLMALAVRILGDRCQAEDLLHDVVLEAWHRARDFDPARGTVRAWLVTRMRSRALDRRASATRQARLHEQAASDVAPGGTDGDAARPDRDRIRQHLAGLPPELTAVVALAYFDGLSFSDMARQLALPIGTVKSRMARALHLLRERLAGPTGGRS